MAVSATDVAAHCPTGNVPYTYTMWVKTVRDENVVVDLLYQGDWGKDTEGRPKMSWVSIRYNTDRGKSDTIMFQHEGCGNMSVRCAGLTDGNWHHLAFTYANRERKIYYDGACVKTGTIDHDLNIYPYLLYFGSRSSIKAGFLGDMDNVGIWRRALTAEEIQYEYDHSFPKPGLVSDALAVPAPVAHWDFNDSSDPYKDTSGIANLNLVADTTAGSCTYSKPADAFGGTVQIANGSFMKTDPTVAWPSRMPSGKSSFSISLRALFHSTTERAAYWYLGPSDTSAMAAYNYLVFGQWSYPAYFAYMYEQSAGSTSSDFAPMYDSWHVASPAAISSVCWQHVVTVYDAGTKTLRHYQDGVLRQTKTLTKALDLAADTLILGHRNDLVKDLWVKFDDVQVFDCALTARQVEKLTRELRTEDVPGEILPRTTGVSVAENASLTIRTPVTQTVKSLSGAGTVNLGVASGLNLTGTGTFSGALVSCGGALTVTNGACVALTGDLTAFTGTLSVFGTLSLGANATNAFVSAQDGSKIVLPYAEAPCEIRSLAVNGAVTLKPTAVPARLPRQHVILKADSLVLGDGAELKLAEDAGLHASELLVDAAAGMVILRTRRNTTVFVR